jgi:hypothetical protein
MAWGKERLFALGTREPPQTERNVIEGQDSYPDSLSIQLFHEMQFFWLSL